ncbi:ScyD/ScyE family protein [Prauserella sp. ASG 168]|uniref:ScyD/ScyE family protein n=1 Tax=Prauserella cavernicola TaxID=2800127 RepID=A0A934QM66_9PSEU|nr:ScyD/ScyE family protein [Prauserella cavernicola]
MRRSRLLLASVATGTTLAMTVAVPAVGQAHWRDGPKTTTIARGLDNPRGLTFGPDGSLYVAEAGRGGAGPCLTGPEGEQVCYGTSGAITKIRHGKQRSVISGLPSLAEPSGGSAIGPSDVSFDRNGKLYFTVGLGADPAVRDQLPKLGRQALGWLLKEKGRHSWRQVADIAGFEARANPDGGLQDSNPNSVLATRHGQYVVDSGGNSLVFVSHRGKVSTVATFGERMVPPPPSLGLPPGTKIPMQSVPTTVTRGPDGALYVGELTGFPFQVGAARVFRVVPGHAPKVVATGFTNIIDIDFDRAGRLFVLEIARNGLLSGDPEGALLRVKHGKPKLVLAKGLNMPAGLTLKHGSAYVSNCGVCAGTGTIEKISLPR